MSALDILKKLEGTDLKALSSLQRILIVTDGTLTEILEAAFLERIQLIKISEKILSATAVHSQLASEKSEPIMERKILLRGAESGKNYVFAESMIALNPLPPAFNDALRSSDIPLGRLWLEHKLETFKELLEVRFERANERSEHFGCRGSDMLLVRVYRVFTAAVPAMIISEYFPVGLS